jgi:4-hydroxy-2-oxoheptanedioate aldolase
MKTNPVKQKLRAGQPSFGSWLTLADIHSARVLARSGFEWLTLDLEHAPIDWSQAAVIFALVAEAGCVPLCRVPEGDHYCIKRALDAGAFGIVVPMVDTAEQARTAIAAARYPPLGNRSVGGGMHSLNFAATADDYYQRANDEILVVLQTESPKGVENAEAIYRLPGCDAVFIGPADLRFTMRAADGRFPTADQHEAMIQRALAIAREARVPLGMHVMDPATALARAAQGMQFIAVATDLRMLTVCAEEFVAALWPDRSAKQILK